MLNSGNGIFQKVMEKVMESHGILASQTCTNPVPGIGVFAEIKEQDHREIFHHKHDVREPLYSSKLSPSASYTLLVDTCRQVISDPVERKKKKEISTHRQLTTLQQESESANANRAQSDSKTKRIHI